MNNLDVWDLSWFCRLRIGFVFGSEEMSIGVVLVRNSLVLI